jgi:serine phosphatase RsbU (regulator of sigma subunit)
MAAFFLYEIPADKMPIAHFDRMDKFRNHEIPVFEGDTIYMFTDGFADQFGGIKGKKFMYKPFKRLLLKNSQLPLEIQEQILSETLEEWMGNISQVDDICVNGNKILGWRNITQTADNEEKLLEG